MMNQQGMLSRNPILILRLMVRLTTTHWDDETFREFSVGPSFGEVREKLKPIDVALRNGDQIHAQYVPETSEGS